MTTTPRYEQYKDTHKFLWTDIRKTLAKEIMYLTPYIDEQRMKEFSNIMLYLQEQIKYNPKLEWNSFMGDYQLRMTEQEMWDWLHDTLFKCTDYQNLNLSYNEREAGIDVDDESRPKITFHTRYDVITEESWKDDFIDLDAVIQNVMSVLCPVHIVDENCIELKSCDFCEHFNKESNECLNCRNNKKLKDNFVLVQTPEMEETNKRYKERKWCKESCYQQYDICCYECDKKDKCPERCCKSFFTNEEDIRCPGMP